LPCLPTLPNIHPNYRTTISVAVPQECTGHISSSFCRFKSHCLYYHHICQFLYTDLWLFTKCNSVQWLSTSILCLPRISKKFLRLKMGHGVA
jgi:hypothetical protein